MHCRTEQYLVTDACLHIHPRRGGAVIDDGGKQTKRWWFPMKRGICPQRNDDDPVSMSGQRKRQRVSGPVLEHGANTFTDHCNLLLHWSEFRDLPNRTLITLTLINKSRYGAVNNDSVGGDKMAWKWFDDSLCPPFFFILMGILILKMLDFSF